MDLANASLVPPGSATGIGSMPGLDPRESARTVLELLPSLPHLVELPARGPGADLVGRGVSLLVGLHGDVQPSGWRLTAAPGRDERLGRSWLGEDLDALEEAAAGYAGPLKLQVTGPVTLAARVEVARGGLAAKDPGARRDLTSSLAQGVADHVAELRRRLPQVAPVLQIDEPMLPAALLGRLPTASGWGTLRPLEDTEAESSLREVVEAAGVPTLVHCCAAGLPVGLVVRAGARGVSLDAGLLSEADDAALGEAVEGGLLLLLGLVPGTGPVVSGRGPAVAAAVAPVRRLWRRLGFAPELLAVSVVVTPACGLAGATPADARSALEVAVAAGRALREEPEG